MKYESPIMDLIYLQESDVITSSDGLVEDDDNSHWDDF